MWAARKTDDLYSSGSIIKSLDVHIDYVAADPSVRELDVCVPDKTSIVLNNPNMMFYPHGSTLSPSTDENATRIKGGMRNVTIRYWSGGIEGQYFDRDYRFLKDIMPAGCRFCLMSNNSFGILVGQLEGLHRLSEPSISQWHRTFPYQEAMQSSGTYVAGSLRVSVARDKRHLLFSASAFRPTYERCVPYDEITSTGLTMQKRDIYMTTGNCIHSSIHPVWIRI